MTKKYQTNVGDVIVFNDSYYSQGFEEGVECINKILRKHGLQINATFLEDYVSDEGEYAHYIIIEKAGEES